MNQPIETGPHPFPSALENARGDWAAFGLVDDIRPALRDAKEARETCALITLHAADGGPRGVGAQMLVSPSTVTGYLSGGCIEADVTHHALATISDGQPRELVYGRGGPIDIRLPCGGRIELLVERIAPDDLAADRLLKLWHERRPALWLSNGIMRSCFADDEVLPDASREAGAAISGPASMPPGNAPAIYRRFLPQNRLVVLGSDPTSLALSTLAAASGMDVVLVRPIGPEAAPPVPGIGYLRSSPKDAFAQIGLDTWTAVVIAMHDDINDDEALLSALPSSAGYVGLLGSSRRLPQKFERLRDRGVAEAAIARLNAPIGLSIGARAPWQIATSIFAEVTQWSTSAERSYAWHGAPHAAD